MVRLSSHERRAVVISSKFLTGIDVNSQRITSVADPTSATDGANKGYIDALVNGLAWKTAVVAASTANIDISSAPGTLDGVSLSSGDRVLLKNQSSASENGIRVYTGTGAALNRASDADTAADLKAATVKVQKGSTNADKQFTLTTDDITLDTTALTWVESQSGTTYAAGTGLEESPASTFRIATTAAGDGLTGGGGSALAVNPGTGLEISSDTVRIASGAAGAGLTGGAGSALAVGAGTGITVNADDVAVDTSVVARKATFASSAAQTTVCTHNLGTEDVMVQIYDQTGKNIVHADVTARSTTAVTVDFGAAVTANQYRIVVTG